MFSYDSGAVRTGTFNGLVEVFLIDVATDDDSTRPAPRPVADGQQHHAAAGLASDLGLTADSGAFDYGVCQLTT